MHQYFKPSVFFCTLFLLTAGCSKPADQISKAAASQVPSFTLTASSIASRASSSPAASLPLIPPPPPDSFQLSEFSPLKKYAEAKLYDNIQAGTESRTIRGRYDLNRDGKTDDVTLRFFSAPDTGKKSTLTLGRKSISLELVDTAGLYVVSLNGYDHELALVDYGMDNDVTTTFFRYTGEGLTQLTQMPGGVEADSRDGYNIPEYNFQILADGKGHLIPRFGLMRYISPGLVLAAEKFDGLEFTRIPVSLTSAVDKSYSLAMDVDPFFQKGDTNASHPDIRCSDNDKIRLKRGQKIALLSVNPSSEEMCCAGVQLPNGSKGILYFYLHP